MLNIDDQDDQGNQLSNGERTNLGILGKLRGEKISPPRFTLKGDCYFEGPYYTICVLKRGPMKNTFVCITLLALLSPCLLAAPGQDETQGVQEAQVTAEKAKIYLEASPFSVVVDTVQRGTVVALFPSGKKDKKWLYISYYSIKRNAQVTGFIKADTIEIFQEMPETQEEKTEEKSIEAKDEENSPLVELDSVKTEKEAKEKALPTESEKPKEIKNKGQVTETPKTAMTGKMENKTEEKKELIEAEAGKNNTETQQVDQTNPRKEEANPDKKQEIQKEESEDTSHKLKTKEEEQAAEKEAEQTALAAAITQPRKKENDGAENHALKKAEEPPAETADRKEAMENPKEDTPQVLTKVSIKARMANIRLMPSLQSAVINRIPSGVELKALAKTGNWYRVNLPPNEDGFVLSGYVHHSIVTEIYESVLPVVEPEEPEEEPEIIEEEPEPVPESEKEIKSPRQTEKSGLSLWIGGGAGYTLPSESHFEKGMSFGGTLGLEIMKYLALEVRIPYFQSDVAESLGGLGSGQLRNLTFMLSVQARYPLTARLVPYLVGGGDYHWNKFSLNDGIKNYWNNLGFTAEENFDHSFGFHVGAGLDFFLLRNIALNVDVRYYMANLKGTWSMADQINQQEVSGPIESLKLNSIQAGISVKFFLGR
jgi:opacity protein-like surface antigen